MSEAEALQHIAEAINRLANKVDSMVFVLWLFLLFKNMGTSKDALDWIQKAISDIGDKLGGAK